MTIKHHPFNLNAPWLRVYKFTTVCLFGLLASTPALASEQLDIRPYEAADQCSADIPQIRVTINDVGSGGILSVGLYDNPKHFLKKEGRKRRIRVPATEGQHTICFNHEEPGTYAVAAYHDKDGNRKINRQWNLMPAEPFGLSNNPEQHFGFPKFSDSAFIADELGADLVINLQEP
ncbi:MAG: DUF2141 domain-containing protein [Nitrosomonas sp.]|nr:DUF2141 domain-containing protein [Nitrosomonas sp.]